MKGPTGRVVGTHRFYQRRAARSPHRSPEIQRSFRQQRSRRASVNPMRSRSLEALLVAGAMALALPAYPQGALRQELTTASTTIPAGGIVIVQNVVTNSSSAPLTGQFSNTVTLDRGTFISATSSNPAIEFSKVPSTGSDSFRGTASVVTLQPNGQLHFDYLFVEPLDTPQGTRVRFQSTVTGFSGQVASGLIFFVIEGVEEAGPRYSLTLERSSSAFFSSAELVYLLTLGNEGTAPTTGPTQILITYEGPFEITDDEISLNGWSNSTAGQYSLLIETVIEEGHKLLITSPIVPISGRGDYKFTAVASGGAPRVEATETGSVDLRAASAIAVPPVVPSSGRVRP